jgi:hypothetical protein
MKIIKNSIIATLFLVSVKGLSATPLLNLSAFAQEMKRAIDQNVVGDLLSALGRYSVKVVDNHFDDGNTPLLYALQEKKIEAAKFLISSRYINYKADVNLAGKQNFASDVPLSLAVQLRNVELVELLLENKAAIPQDNEAVLTKWNEVSEQLFAVNDDNSRTIIKSLQKHGILPKDNTEKAFDASEKPTVDGQVDKRSSETEAKVNPFSWRKIITNMILRRATQVGAFVQNMPTYWQTFKTKWQNFRQERLSALGASLFRPPHATFIGAGFVNRPGS